MTKDKDGSRRWREERETGKSKGTKETESLEGVFLDMGIKICRASRSGTACLIEVLCAVQESWLWTRREVLAPISMTIKRIRQEESMWSYSVQSTWERGSPVRDSVNAQELDDKTYNKVGRGEKREKP
jgi:hypothetical protein